ncbi:hypothetical protein TanjilG_17853 [Lupinus angustifolius]|uniref:Uncharacterized protein n=1 Tax=Lupinus angustifolius TaxID=3871 RepID=A0A4P1QPZ2_LUPAN|nr:hypothetical protein TanjilG_17853 [Lupinus angustifolius]
MTHISDIKLIRTDTTLDLSQKAEKGMIIFVATLSFYTLSPICSFLFHLCGTNTSFTSQTPLHYFLLTHPCDYSIMYKRTDATFTHHVADWRTL